MVIAHTSLTLARRDVTELNRNPRARTVLKERQPASPPGIHPALRPAATG